MPADNSAPATKPAHNGTLSLLLDFGPLLVFFLGYRMFGVIMGTAIFMAAIVIAVIVSKWQLGRISPMLWLSAILVLFFGSLTIYFDDMTFIKIKPTIIYSFFALMLFAGLLRGKPLLKYLLQAAYDGLTEEGWRKLSRNWAFFFVFLAVTNETARKLLSDEQWLLFKALGVTTASFLFAAANIPMLMRHGLSVGDKVDSDEIGETTPPQG
ncbi:MAG: septation protein IspZ [Sphingobium sp.]|uniref:septation protein IspZ n=1 Tax=Sphingobium sp. CECT 9361 TaxID=2845384 RepID=UPI001E4E5DC5|nr:septation protein IspZ [Sphingobium sp. CECT 9361]CAH0353730.1 Intracellular septation protein [Sphingobium sp. CECT 9361]